MLCVVWTGACGALAPTANDAGPDGSKDADIETSAVDSTTTYGSLTDVGNWETFDLNTLTLNDPEGVIYNTASFDGRYVYLAPQAPTVVQYDTSGSFSAPTSWSTFDMTAITSTNERGYLGTAFDHRYVYFAPSPCPGCLDVVRYDTQGDIRQRIIMVVLFDGPAVFNRWLDVLRDRIRWSVLIFRSVLARGGRPLRHVGGLPINHVVGNL